MTVRETLVTSYPLLLWAGYFQFCIVYNCSYVNHICTCTYILIIIYIFVLTGTECETSHNITTRCITVLIVHNKSCIKIHVI